MGNFVLMPKLGMTMTEGKIIKWLRGEGDPIGKGDHIVEVETDKTSLEVDSLYDGKLLRIYFGDGEDIPVNTPIAFIGEEGEEIPPKPDIGAAKAAPAPEPRKQAAAVEKIDTGGYDYGLVVIGAGPGGYVGAIRAAQLGAKVAVIDRGEAGGTCLNRGCIPTKALYTSAEMYTKMRHAADYGLRAEAVGFDWAAVMKRKDRIVKQLTGGVRGLFKKNGIDFIQGEARMADAHTVAVDGKTVTGAYIMVAAGTVPFSVLKDVGPGVDIMDTDDVLSMEKLPDSMAVIGGGVIGVEIANIMAAFGVKVTIVELTDSVIPMADGDVAALLAKKLKAKGVDIRTSVTADKIVKSGQGALLKLSDGSELECGAVLEAVGRRPALGELKLPDVGMTEKGFIRVDGAMRTNVPNIFAVGDVTGGYMLAHEASKQGEIAAEAIFGEYAEADMVMPSCIFTEPEIAFVGLTEKDAKEQGYEVRTFSFPFMANGKALTLGEKDGFVKVVADARYGEILGVHIIGPEASSLIHEAAVAISLEATAEYAGRVIHAHPTLSEAMMEAFLGASIGAIHI